MSKVDLYNGIVAELTDLPYTATSADGLTTGTKKLKTVGLWRNQIEREKEENAFLYPAVFIEFLSSNYMESSSKVYQTLDMTVRLHICFWTTKTVDLDILSLTQAVYGAMQLKQYGTFGVMKRRNEEQDFDHPNVQDFIQDYDVGKAKDYNADKRPSTEVTVTPVIFVNTEPTPPPFDYVDITTEGGDDLATERNEPIITE